MASCRPAMKTADYAIYAALICVWTLPWAAVSGAMFDPWQTKALFSPVSGFWNLAFVLYVIDCVATPSMLLLAGLSIATTGRGCRWLVAWTATLAAGFVFEFKTLLFVSHMFGPLAPVSHGNWEVLGWGGGFALLALAAGALLAGSPRAALAMARRRGRGSSSHDEP
jgi:hypothetical protein